VRMCMRVYSVYSRLVFQFFMFNDVFVLAVCCTYGVLCIIHLTMNNKQDTNSMLITVTVKSNHIWQTIRWYLELQIYISTV
jgi:hypothetical protein